MCFKQKRILMKTFFLNSVRSCVSLWVWNKSEFFWRHLLSLSWELCEFMSFIQKGILQKTFLAPHFQFMQVYEFQTKATFYQDICWVSVWSYLDLRVSNKTEFLWRHLFNLTLELCEFMSFILWVSYKKEFFWRHLLSLSLKLRNFISFKQKRILTKTFVESQFEVM